MPRRDSDVGMGPCGLGGGVRSQQPPAWPLTEPELSTAGMI